MTLQAGVRLGQYEIVAPLGAGGMGEVYHAKDSKLGRSVALKVVRQPFDADLLTRFDREARLLASFTHPNIATLYGADEANGVRYLVMELVPGRTLAERLQTGPLDLKEALEIAVQVAAALDCAHDRGIVHRDLKPANVKVTPEGSVKVLDFGLAKMLLSDASSQEPGVSFTQTAAGTRQGTILGTTAYMSPEQARGEPVDRRTDIWAFGCLLYELLTGRRAFAGETISDTIAAIIDRDPPWDALPGSTPPGIRRLIRRCLMKDSRRRLRDIGDAWLEIQDALASPSGQLGVATRLARIRRTALPWALSALVVGVGLGAGGTLWLLRREAAPSRPVARFLIALPPSTQLAGLDFPALAVSPLGTHIAYVASRGAGSQLFLRSIDTLESTPLAGTEQATGPFFSPDGRWIGFFAGGKLQKVSLTGGAPVVLCPAPIGFGGTWGRDVIVFAPTNGSALWKVSASGGTPEPVTELDSAKGEFSHRWPELLPDGRTVLFTIGTRGSWDDAELAAQSLETGQRQVLIQGGSDPRYIPTGHLLYVRGGSLMAVAFDAVRLQVSGQPVPIIANVMQSFDGAAQFAISATGRSLVYVAGSAEGAERSLVWVDRHGVPQPLAAPPRAYDTPRLSPDGRAVIVTIEGERDNLWLYDVSAGSLRQLTFEGANSSPLWTPDGTRVTFSSTRTGPANLFWKRIEGGADERLTTAARLQVPLSWSPDGRTLAFLEHDTVTARDVWTLALDGARTPRPLLHSPANESWAVFSRDGRWLAYVSDESGRSEVYVTPFPGDDRRLQISTDGGTEPVWGPDGRELFYRSGERMMTARVITTGGSRAVSPTVLFEGAYERGHSQANFDVDHDGTRFLMVRAIERESLTRELQVVQEWFDELIRRVPRPR